MSRRFVMVASTWVGIGLLALAGLDSGVESRLLAKTAIRTGDIDVSSSQGTVTLIGRVASEAIRSEAGRIARDTRGVRRVQDHLLAGKIRSWLRRGW